MRLVGMISLGCPKNTVDSETMLGTLGTAGYEITSSLEEAEVIIINTCSFIKPAVEESIETIIECLQLKKRGSCRCLVVTGCLPQRYGKVLSQLIPEVDVWYGVNAPLKIVEGIEKAFQGEKVVAVSPVEEYHLNGNLPRLVLTPPYSAYLKVAEGCSHSCSFCIIPKLRGRLQSRTIESLVSEASQLAASGARELVLVAQDTGAYGKDLYGRPALHLLLKRLVGVPGIDWIRILYLHPCSLSPELIATISEEPKICKYLDLPFQHASRKVLRKMGRKGSAQEYLDRIEELRSLIPGIALRTTLMVGFPGEDEEDYQELLGFVEKARFDRLGVFPYYREEGTRSFSFPGQVSYLKKKQRCRQLLQLQREISRRKNEELVGKQLSVLIESKVGEGVYIGRSYREAPEIDPKVIVAGNNLKVGEFVRVEITRAAAFDLMGVAI